MNLFEFVYFGVYLSFLTLMLVAIQVYQPGKQSSEDLSLAESEEPFVEEEEEEEEEELEVPALETLDYTMTENPMFRHRNVSTLIDQVD